MLLPDVSLSSLSCIGTSSTEVYKVLAFLGVVDDATFEMRRNGGLCYEVEQFSLVDSVKAFDIIKDLLNFVVKLFLSCCRQKTTLSKMTVYLQDS